jgi:hypothetical protein
VGGPTAQPVLLAWDVLNVGRLTAASFMLEISARQLAEPSTQVNQSDKTLESKTRYSSHWC